MFLFFVDSQVFLKTNGPNDNLHFETAVIELLYLEKSSINVYDMNFKAFQYHAEF